MLEISTPALVFPALSVLMLAYTNKFIAISKRVRALHAEHKNNPTKNLRSQLEVMGRRMRFIRNMQTTALSGFSANLLAMAFIFIGLQSLALFFFSAGLALVFCSLIICIMEIQLSTKVMTLLMEEDLDNME